MSDECGPKFKDLPAWAQAALKERKRRLKLGVFKEATPEENAKFGQFAPGIPDRRNDE